MKRPTLLAAGLLCATALVARPAAAEAPALRWTLEASGGAQFISGGSYNFVTASRSLGVGDLRFGFSPGWLGNRLELEFAYVGGAAGGSTLQSYTTNLQIHSLQLGAKYRQPLGSYFNFFGRAAVLLDFDGLTLSSSDNAAVQLSQTAVTGGLELAAGAGVFFYSGPRLQFGIQAEFGYAFRSAARFNDLTATGTNSAGSTHIAMAGINAGSLDVSGWQIRGGVVFHF